MYVRCDESSLHSRINYVHSPDGELLWRECPGIIKTMRLQGLAVHVLHYANAPVLTRKKLTLDFSVKDLCSVLNALSK